MTFSDYLSIIALVISALALFLSWRQYVRDQSHLKLNVDVQSDMVDGPMFIVKAVNQGRRPITIVRANARVSSGKAYPVFDTRTVLDETETLEFKVEFSGFFRTMASGYYIKAFEFEDTTGKRHIIKTSRLRKEVEKILQGLG